MSVLNVFEDFHRELTLRAKAGHPLEPAEHKGPLFPPWDVTPRDCLLTGWRLFLSPACRLEDVRAFFGDTSAPDDSNTDATTDDESPARVSWTVELWIQEKCYLCGPVWMLPSCPGIRPPIPASPGSFGSYSKAVRAGDHITLAVSGPGFAPSGDFEATVILFCRRAVQ